MTKPSLIFIIGNDDKAVEKVALYLQDEYDYETYLINNDSHIPGSRTAFYDFDFDTFQELSSKPTFMGFPIDHIIEVISPFKPELPYYISNMCTSAIWYGGDALSTELSVDAVMRSRE